MYRKEQEEKFNATKSNLAFREKRPGGIKKTDDSWTIPGAECIDCIEVYMLKTCAKKMKKDQKHETSKNGILPRNFGFMGGGIHEILKICHYLVTN